MQPIMKKLNRTIKIIGILLLSFIAVTLFSKEIFLADSPKMRSNLFPYLVSRFRDRVYSSRSTIAHALNTLNPYSAENQLKKVPYSLVSKGVYAKSKENVSYTLFKINEVEWIRYSYIIKGKTVTIEIPKGQVPMTQQEMEQIY